MNDELDKFQSLWADLDSTLKSWCAEAKELRHPVDEENLSDDVTTIHEHLIASRRSQDRLEAILANVGRMRARVRKLVAELQDQYEDQWRTTMQNTRTGEYLSARAQDSTYDVGSVQELVNLRRGKRYLADVEEVFDFVFIKHRGLENQIRDYKDRLRAVNVEAHYER